MEVDHCSNLYDVHDADGCGRDDHDAHHVGVDDDAETIWVAHSVYLRP